jgi:DNA-binding transcriptional LysR family regulator
MSSTFLCTWFKVMGSAQPQSGCNNGEVLAEAALQGLGITLLPDFIIEDALSDGRLVRILEGRERSPLVLSVLYPSRRHVPVKTRSFIDYAVEQL